MKKAIIIALVFFGNNAGAQMISSGPTAANVKPAETVTVKDTTPAKVIPLSITYGATAEPIGNKVDIKVEQKGSTVTASYENNESRAAGAEIKLINSSGETVKVIHQGKLTAGKQQFTIDTRSLGAGMYYLISTIEGRQFAEKLLLK